MTKRLHGNQWSNESWNRDILQLICILRLRFTPMVTYEAIANQIITAWPVSSLRWCGYNFTSIHDIPEDFDVKGAIHEYLCSELSRGFEAAEKEQTEVWLLARDWDENFVKGLLKMDWFEGKGFELAEQGEMEAQIKWRKEGDWRAGSEPQRPTRRVKENMRRESSASQFAMIRRRSAIECGRETTKLSSPGHKIVGAQDMVPIKRQPVYQRLLTGVTEGGASEEAVKSVSIVDFSPLKCWPAKPIGQNAIDDSYLTNCNHSRDWVPGQNSEDLTVDLPAIEINRLRQWSPSPSEFTHPAHSFILAIAQDAIEDRSPSALHPESSRTQVKLPHVLHPIPKPACSFPLCLSRLWRQPPNANSRTSRPIPCSSRRNQDDWRRK